MRELDLLSRSVWLWPFESVGVSLHLQPFGLGQAPQQMWKTAADEVPGTDHVQGAAHEGLKEGGDIPAGGEKRPDGRGGRRYHRDADVMGLRSDSLPYLLPLPGHEFWTVPHIGVGATDAVGHLADGAAVGDRGRREYPVQFSLRPLRFPPRDRVDDCRDPVSVDRQTDRIDRRGQRMELRVGL